MRNEASSDAPAREPLRTMVSRLALLGVDLGSIGAAMIGFDVAARPPCDPGYVRLLDLEPVGAVVSFALAGLALVVHWRSRRGAHLKMMTGVIVVILLCVALVDLTAVATLVHHHGASYDSDCWTC